MTDCNFCKTTLDVGELVVDNNRQHKKCLVEHDCRVDNGKCVFCGKPANPNEHYSVPCDVCGDGASYKDYPGPQ